MCQRICIMVSMFIVAACLAEARPLDEGLLNAVGKCDPELVELLIQKGADVNSTARISNTVFSPLYVALSSTSEAYRQMDYHKRDAEKETFERCEKVLVLLFSHKADPNLSDTYLFERAMDSSYPDGLVELLLKNGANPDLLNTHIVAPSGARLLGTVLMAIVYSWPLGEDVSSRLQQIFSLALSKSTNINQQGSAGQTVLMIAANKGYVEIVQKLVKAGANPNLKDKQGRTVLDYAILGGHTNVIKILQ